MQIASNRQMAIKATDSEWLQVMFALWQESVLSDPVASMEDDFILKCLTWSDFIE